MTAAPGKERVVTFDIPPPAPTSDYSSMGAAVGVCERDIPSHVSNVSPPKIWDDLFAHHLQRIQNKRRRDAHTTIQFGQDP